MSDTTLSKKDLFGGAISVMLPSQVIDASYVYIILQFQFALPYHLSIQRLAPGSRYSGSFFVSTLWDQYHRRSLGESGRCEPKRRRKVCDMGALVYNTSDHMDSSQVSFRVSGS